jgi:hypothetical protein
MIIIFQFNGIFDDFQPLDGFIMGRLLGVLTVGMDRRVALVSVRRQPLCHIISDVISVAYIFGMSIDLSRTDGG